MDYTNNKIIRLYKEAWETHNVKLLSTIFHKNIVYNDRDINLFNGINELEQYWKINAQKQINVHFNPLKIIELNNNIILQWEATFFHNKKNKKKYLKGIIWIKIKNKKIKKFTEYFERKYID